MFTGIVERSLSVASVSDGTGFRRINLPNPWNDVKPGESIAVNGVCLTMAEMDNGLLAFDIVPETLDKTNLGHGLHRCAHEQVVRGSDVRAILGQQGGLTCPSAPTSRP